jgi:hypothetical protein
MKLGTMMITAGVLALGLATFTPSKAQGPLYDRVNVNLPYSVSIGERTLPPGDYVIQQLRDQGGGSRVLLIYSDNGMKFETSAMTIPALEGNNVTQENTRVILHHFGSDYYFDKVWIQGKDYGYEFPLPDAVKSRQRERLEPISVAANYSTVPSTDAATSQNTTASAATTSSTTASAATSGQTTKGQAAESAATTQRTTTAQAAPTPATTQSTTTAQATQAAATTPSTTSGTMTAQNQATTQPSTTSGRSTMAPATTPSTTAATSTGTADRSMPNTSAGWLMMLLSGGTLSGVGMALRRKR